MISENFRELRDMISIFKGVTECLAHWLGNKGASYCHFRRLETEKRFQLLSERNNWSLSRGSSTRKTTDLSVAALESKIRPWNKNDFNVLR